jgi:hypothetical protein
MDGERASRAYCAFCRWRASLGAPVMVALGLVGWLAGQGRPERAPSPVRAPIAGEKTGRALLVVSGAGGWLRLAARCGLSALPAVVPACERSRSAGSRSAGSRSAPGRSTWEGFRKREGRTAAGLRKREGGAAARPRWEGRERQRRTGRPTQGTRPRSCRGLGPAPRRAAPRTRTPRRAQPPRSASRLPQAAFSVFSQQWAHGRGTAPV